MRVSTVRLYHQIPWEYFIVYRWSLVVLRSLELLTIIIMYLAIRAPLQVLGIRRLKKVELASGGDVLLKSTPLPKVGMDVDEDEGKRRLSGYGVVRVIFEEMGPSFIKLAQIVSMRPEPPEPLRRELQKVQERVPVMSFKEVRSIVERELTTPLEEAFSSFEEKPFASASLGQVHRAVLRKEGVEVAVKVQRRHLEAITTLDTTIINSLYMIVRSLFPNLRKKTDAKMFTVGFATALRREIDFIKEARNAEMFEGIISQYPVYRKNVKIPRIYWDYSSDKMLTMELLRGLIRIDTVEAEDLFRCIQIEEEPFSHYPMPLLWVFSGLCFDMMLKWGFWHADIHTGNAYVTKDGQIALVDFGMCELMSEGQRDRNLRFFHNMLFYCDANKIADSIQEICLIDGSAKEGDIDYTLLREHVGAVLEKVLGVSSPSKRQTGANVVNQCFYVLAFCGVKLPPHFWLLFKTLMYWEEFVDRYMPGLDFRDLYKGMLGEDIKGRVIGQLDSMNLVTINRESVGDLIEQACRPKVPGLPKLFVKKWGYEGLDLDPMSLDSNGARPCDSAMLGADEVDQVHM